MADQAQEQPKADPAAAQYVVNLTPEQYEGYRKQTAPDTRPQMEVGGTGTAKVSFKDTQGADVKIVSSQWTSTEPMTVTVTADDADPPDPTSAKLVATAPGRATIRAVVATEAGSTAEASVEVVVIETGTPVAGTIEITVEAPAKAPAAA